MEAVEKVIAMEDMPIIGVEGDVDIKEDVGIAMSGSVMLLGDVDIDIDMSVAGQLAMIRFLEVVGKWLELKGLAFLHDRWKMRPTCGPDGQMSSLMILSLIFRLVVMLILSWLLRKERA